MPSVAGKSSYRLILRISSRVDARREIYCLRKDQGFRARYAGQRFRKPEIVVRGGRFARLSVEARGCSRAQQGRELMQGRIASCLKPSMPVLLDDWLPRLLGWVDGQRVLCIPHEGKTTLDHRHCAKAGCMAHSGDHLSSCGTTAARCVAVKRSLQALCAQGGRPETMVRLVCQERGLVSGRPGVRPQPLTSQRWIPRRIASVSGSRAWQNRPLKSNGWFRLFKRWGRAPWPAICPRKTMDPQLEGLRDGLARSR